MDAGSPVSAGRADDVSRRRLLQLAGGVGLVAAVGGCTGGTDIGTTARATSSSATAPAAPPPEPSASPAAATSAILLCRDAWGARPARSGGRPHTITRMTLHHTAVVLGDNRNAPARLRQHQQYHMDDHGWIDIAYHVSVDRNGNIYQLRRPELAGDTATDYDPAGHFLVLCEGDFDQESVSEAQLHSAAVAFAWAAQNFHIASDTLAGHRDVASTSCPGADLYAPLSSGELKRRIDDLIAGGAVDLQQLCGPEAAVIAAEIEQGR